MATLEEEIQFHNPGLADALAAAEEGDMLELDLVSSGFYGSPEDGPGGPDDAAARHGIALRALGDFLVRLREYSVDRRWGVDENTLLNMAFRFGHHYVEVDKARRAVVATPAPRDAIRRKVNKFEPWWRQQHSKLTSGIPSYQVKPTNRQQLDYDASAFAEDLSEWRVKSLYSLNHRGAMSMWKLMGGAGVMYIGVEWVPDPEYLVDAATGQPLYRPEIVEEVLPPQACWCDDRIPTIKEMRWFGVDRFVPVAEARATYPEHYRRIEPEVGGMERGLHYLRRLQRMTNTENPWGGADHIPAGAIEVEEEEETILPEFWLRKGAHLSVKFLDWLDPSLVPFEIVDTGEDEAYTPIIHFPEGLRVVFTTQGDVLEVSPNIHGHLPFREMRFSKSPGFWSYAPATPLREIQLAYNWISSMRETHVLKVGNAPLLEPREARIQRRGYITSAMSRIRYRAGRNGVKPEYLDPPNMPADLNMFESRLDQIWQDIAGLHEVSSGKLPSSDLSGVTVSLLLEQDMTQLGYAGEEQEEAFIDMLRMELLIIQKFFPASDPRLVNLAGDARYKLEAFMVADLESGLDIQVVKGSSIPRSPAAVEAKAQQGWEQGWLVDRFGRPDFRTMRRVNGFGTEDELEQEEEVDVQNARNAEDMILSSPPELLILALQQYLATGSLPPGLAPLPEDDPFVFEQEHRLRLKRLQHDPRADPLAVEVLRARWSHYAQLVALIDPLPGLGLLGAGPTEGDEGGGEEGGGDGPPA